MTNYTPRFELSLSPEHYTEIGRVAAYWSKVEHCAQSLVWRLIKMPGDNARRLTAALRSETQLDIIVLLCKSDFAPSTEICDRALELVKRIKELRDERHEVVHGPWRARTNDPEVIKLKGKGESLKLVPRSANEIQALYVKIAALSDDLMDLLISYDLHR
jgi:protein-tyrosine-phosphatase